MNYYYFINIYNSKYKNFKLNILNIFCLQIKYPNKVSRKCILKFFFFVLENE